MKIPISTSYKFKKILDRLQPAKNHQPPNSMSFFTGDGDFEQIGKYFVNLFIKYGNLRPTSNMLDVGCGAGRMAIPLTDFLTTGTYDGFDVFRDGIEWCKKNISRNHTNFKFIHVDIYNKNYNPKGRLTATDFSFPYDADSFDFVCANSLFTHLMPHDLKNYIIQIHRVLKKSGTFFLSLFLLNQESKNLIKQEKSNFKFTKNLGVYAIEEHHFEEQAICYCEDYIKKTLLESGFNIKEIHYGNWCGRQQFLDGQDIIICTKTTN